MKNIIKEKDTFNFFVPLTLEKSNNDSDKIDYSNMIISGIASPSDSSVDMDGEILDPKGFDLSYFKSNGFINWHHQANVNPSAIIGEPIEAKITKNGLFVKGKLYEDSEVAKKVYDLGIILQKNSQKRALGWSIEGKILEKAGIVVKKAAITGMALTHSPKNSNTFAEVCKAMVDGSTTEKILSSNENDSNVLTIKLNDGNVVRVVGGKIDFIEKAMEANGSGEPLKKESLLGSKTVIYDENYFKIMKKIYSKYPEISFEKANEVCEKVIKNL